MSGLEGHEEKCTSFKYKFEANSRNDDIMSSMVSDYDLVCDKAHYVPKMWSVFSISTILGSSIGGLLIDRLGKTARKFRTNPFL